MRADHVIKKIEKVTINAPHLILHVSEQEAKEFLSFMKEVSQAYYPSTKPYNFKGGPNKFEGHCRTFLSKFSPDRHNHGCPKCDCEYSE